MADKEPVITPVIEDDDKPHYQESITFIVSVVAQTAILIWCLVVLSLGYVKLPNKLFGMDIPDQPRVDSTFAAGLLGNILAGMGVSVNAAANGNGKKKKREEELKNNIGTQTIVIKQPLEIIAPNPEISKDK